MPQVATSISQPPAGRFASRTPTATATMMSASRFRAAHRLSQQLRLSQRTFASTARQLDSTAVSTTNREGIPETTDASGQPTETMQAPNRHDIWARSQQPRSKAMVGPRFEQTDLSLQVRAEQSDCLRVHGLLIPSTAATLFGNGARPQAACAVDA